MPFATGENVGAYRVMEQLGQGGMATVYKAYHAALDRYVALKVLHPAFGEDPNFEARFQREARVVAKLEHPNIVPIYDYAEHGKQPYLVMKFIEGETLKARMARGPLQTAEMSRVIEAVGAALGYAHKNGILHRDIKPSNVLLANDGSIFLADFGLARIASLGESTLSGDIMMGTPQYISPEQAMGKKDLDEGTDIYSFGVMLYELVVGQVPFNADTPFSIIHDHIYTALPIPRTINPNVPEAVERVLLKALSKERADRFASVAELASAFQEAWLGAGTPMKGTTLTLPAPKVTSAPSTPEPAAAESESKKRRSRWTFAAVAFLIVACCLFILLANRRAGLVDTPRTTVTSALTAGLPSETALHGLESPTSSAALTGEPTHSPAVLEAIQNVNANPTSAQAHLTLALAYWDAGEQRLAYDTLNTAADLAGNDTSFFLSAAEQFGDRGAWIASAGMHLRAVKTLPVNVPVPIEIEIDLHEAVYEASSNADLPLFLPFDSILRVDEPIGLVAQTRFALFNGTVVEAREFLNRARRLSPNMPEVSLVEAELNIKDGKIVEARRALIGITSNLEAPAWVRAFAQTLLSQIP